MELNFVLLLSTIVHTTMVIDRVQGYYTDSNSTTISSGKYKPIYNNELIERGRQQNKRQIRQQFDQAFRHYSASENRREPRFISFNTKDDNIEVEIDFAIPFLSIPVKRSLSGAMGTIQNAIKVSSSYNHRSRCHRDLELFCTCFSSMAHTDLSSLFSGHSDGKCQCWGSSADRDRNIWRRNDRWHWTTFQWWIVR